MSYIPTAASQGLSYYSEVSDINGPSSEDTLVQEIALGSIASYGPNSLAHDLSYDDSQPGEGRLCDKYLERIDRVESRPQEVLDALSTNDTELRHQLVSKKFSLRDKKQIPLHKLTIGLNDLYMKIRRQDPRASGAPNLFSVPYWLQPTSIPHQFSTTLGLITVKSPLGEGMYGEVYAVELSTKESNRKDRTCIAAALKVSKSLSYGKNQDAIFKKSLTHEYSILQHICYEDSEDHYSIGRLISGIELSQTRFGILQILYKENLHQHLEKLSSYCSFKNVYNVGYQLINTLKLFQEIDQGPLLHCDLKPENIVLEGSIDGKIRIIDFGMARKKNQTNSNRKKDYIVSRFYRAPEIVLGLPYGTMIDQWSVACILYEMVVKTPLFPAKSADSLLEYFTVVLGDVPLRMRPDLPSLPSDHEDLSRCVQAETSRVSEYIQSKLARLDLVKVNPEIPADELNSVKELFADLLARVLNWDASQRITLEECLDHPFMVRMKVF